MIYEKDKKGIYCGINLMKIPFLKIFLKLLQRVIDQIIDLSYKLEAPATSLIKSSIK